MFLRRKSDSFSQAEDGSITYIAFDRSEEISITIDRDLLMELFSDSMDIYAATTCFKTNRDLIDRLAEYKRYQIEASSREMTLLNYDLVCYCMERCLTAVCIT